MNAAEKIAAQLDNDGSVFETADGVSFDELVKGASVDHYTNRGGNGEYRLQSVSDHCDGDVIAYTFTDGSRLISVGPAWDVYDDNGWGIVLEEGQPDA